LPSWFVVHGNEKTDHRDRDSIGSFAGRQASGANQLVGDMNEDEIQLFLGILGGKKSLLAIEKNVWFLIQNFKFSY
jgi:hypothetical protein